MLGYHFSKHALMAPAKVSIIKPKTHISIVGNRFNIDGLHFMQSLKPHRVMFWNYDIFETQILIRGIVCNVYNRIKP